MATMTRTVTLRRIAILAVIALSLSIVIFYPPLREGTRTTLRSSSRSVLLPLRRAGAFSRGIWTNISASFLSYRENQSLRAERETLLVDKIEFEQLKRENNELRDALDMQMAMKRPVARAAVVGSFAEGRDEYLIIEKGDIDVKEGSPVLSSDGVLIGIIRTVDQRTATARFITSPAESVTVQIYPSGAEGVMRGDNSGEYAVSLIPREASIRPGDAVATAGRNAAIPAGTPVGIVVEAAESESNPFLDVRVKTPVDLSLIEYVIVMTP